MSPLLRVRVVESRGYTYDDALLYPGLPWTGPGARPRLHVVLRGALRIRECGVERWLERGGFSVARSLGSVYVRYPAPGARILCVEWEGGVLGGLPLPGLPEGQLAPRDVAFLEGAVDALEHVAPEPNAKASAVRDILGRLRASGIPLEDLQVGDLTTQVSPRDQRLAEILGGQLSALHGKPSLVDLESALGVSPRQAIRLVDDFCIRYGYNGDGWRSLLDRWRLTAAAAMVAMPASRTEDIANWVGYSNPSVLCRSFHRALLPSPGNVRDALKALG